MLMVKKLRMQEENLKYVLVQSREREGGYSTVSLEKVQHGRDGPGLYPT